MPNDIQILGTKAHQLPVLTSSIPDEQLIIVPNPTTGKLYRTTFAQLKADVIAAFGDISFLDQIVEVPTVADLPQPGQIKTIYVITSGPDENKQFRWGGSIYIEFPRGAGNVDAEALIRAQADADLQAQIDAEKLARQNADTTLQGNISQEATLRSNADAILNQKISAEINARQQGDTTLQALLNTEGQVRAQADLDIDQRVTELENRPGGGDGPATTDELPEGETNLYFTDARAQAALSNDITSLGLGLNNEATERADADTFLMGKILEKVDKETGKGLSQENYTLEEKNKLAGLESSKYRGEYASLSALQAAHPVGEPGWYADVDEGVGADVVRYIWDSTDSIWVSQKGTSTAETAASVKAKYESNPDTNAFTDARRDKLEGIEAGAQKNLTNTTLQGNEFNGAEQLTKTGADGKLPESVLPSSPSGGVTEQQVKEISAVGFHGVASGTNTYTATITGLASVPDKSTLKIQFTKGNTGASSLDVGFGPMAVKRPSGADLVQDDIRAGGIYEVTKNGSVWQLMGVGASAIPKVVSGEKVVTQKADGTHVDYDLGDPGSLTATTGPQLESQDWSSGTNVTYTGVYGEERFWNNWKYECIGPNTWCRYPANYAVKDIVIGSINDSAGKKTSGEMAALYPNAVAPQIVTGYNGMYQFFDLQGWFYFENTI